MTAFLGYQTGIDLWRMPEVYKRVSLVSQDSFRAPSAIGIAPWEVEGTTSTFWRDVLSKLDRPWEVIVSSKERIHSTQQIRYHLRSASLPPRSGLEISEGIYLASPELCLLQMAESLPLTALIELMDEFCGTYRLPNIVELESVETEPDKVVSLAERPPLTSVKRLTAYFRASAGVRGVVAARRALAYAVDASASPKETHSEMLLCLPAMLGGKGLPKPVMNKRFDIPPQMRQRGDKSYLVCDICLKVLRGGRFRYVDLEYESSEWHADSVKLAEDSRRRNLLESLGVYVITLTASELYSVGGFNRVAQLVADAIGFRLRTELSPSDAIRLRDALRKTLLGTSRP